MQRCVDRQAGFTLVELLVVVAILGVVAAMSLGHLLRARLAANEASAIGTVRAVNSGENVYRSTCGQGNFSASLVTLVNAGFLNPDANLSPKSGFTFTLTPGGGTPGNDDCAGGVTGTEFYFGAMPVAPSTGRRGFATDENGTIWQDLSGVAPPEPFTASATVATLH